ncbi:MAG TPA: hypothetical protein VJ957_01775 [Longimicrobiales bacterium]|nr:hypothetical protein [Longimicrobiales bacterium]
MRRKARPGWLALAAAVVFAAPAEAQQQQPWNNTVLVGAAGVMYGASANLPGRGMTMVHFMPTFLASFGPDLLFEGELHFTPGADGVETEVEYAQIDYQRFDHLQLVAGQFLLPFGVFGERLHMGWIDKMPDLPLLYADEAVAEDELMSLPSDLGVMARYARSLTPTTDLNMSLYATQGPHMDTPPAPGEPADVSFGNTFADQNSNKLLGARVGVVVAPKIEVYGSGFLSTYDAASTLHYNAANLAAIWRPLGTQVLGEWTNVWQQFAVGARTSTLKRSGYFVQAARRFGNFEPVVRWEQLGEGQAAGTVFRDALHRVGLGLDYWVTASMPIKAAYEWVSGGDDQFIVQWVFGF